MKLTTKGRYAVTAMLDLAVHAEEKPVTLQDISTRQSISLSYLEQLFAKLKRANLVKSARGPGGGYQLKRPTGEIAIAMVIDAVNENTDVTACGKKADCNDGKTCIAHDLWCELSDQIHSFLSGVTLQSVIEKNQPKSETVKIASSKPEVIRTSSATHNTFVLTNIS